MNPRIGQSSNPSGAEQLNEFIRLQDRLLRLLDTMQRPPAGSGGLLTQHYNRLRGQVAVVKWDPAAAALPPRRLLYIEHSPAYIALAVFFSFIVAAASAVLSSTFGIAPLALLFFVLWGGLLLGLRAAISLTHLLPGPVLVVGSIQEVQEQTELLLSFVKAQIAEADPEVLARLQTNSPRWAVGKSLSTAPQSLVGGQLKLSHTERRHLQTQLTEQRRRYRELTERIAAVTTDMSREMDAERKLTLKTRLQELTDERDQVQTLLRTIERALTDGQTLEGGHQDSS